MVCWFLTLSAIVLACGQKCTFDCDACDHLNFYDVVNDTINSSSCVRNDKAYENFLIGPSFCAVGGEYIRDNKTCESLIKCPQGFEKWRIDFGIRISHVNVEWDDSRGCEVVARPGYWLPLHGDSFRSVVCLETNTNYKGAILSIGVGMIAGVVWACCSYGFKFNNVFSNPGEKHPSEKTTILAGAKYVAAKAILKKERAHLQWLARIYRFCQAASNACLPAIMPIFIEPLIVLAFYLILYVLPAAVIAPVLRDNIYLVAVPDISLYGIDEAQPRKLGGRLGSLKVRREVIFLYDAIRPYIMVLLTLITAVVASTITGKNGTGVNETGFYRSGLQAGWAPLVLRVSIFGTVLGTLLYSLLTLMLILQAGGKIIPITIFQDARRQREVAALADKIATDIAEIERETGGAASQEDFHEYFCSNEIEEFHLSRRQFWVEICASLATSAAWMYKIFVFMSSGQFHLAFALVCLLVHSFSLMMLRGTCCRTGLLQRSRLLGIRTADFYDVVCWSAKGASVVNLMVTIYGLPLTNTVSPWSCCAAIALQLAAMYNLAIANERAIDLDMFDVYKKGHPNSDDSATDEFVEVPDEDDDSDSGDDSDHEDDYAYNTGYAPFARKVAA